MPSRVAQLPPELAKRLVVITAPSGAGKTTLITRLMAEDPNLVFSVSHTTRAPRPGEVDGRQYHFVTPERFLSMVDEGAFIEWAEVHGRFYGTSFAEIRRLAEQGKRIVLDIDVQGGIALQARVTALYIFIGVESIDVLKERLLKRGTETPDSLAIRLLNAEHELEQAKHWPHVVVNRDLDVAQKEIRRLLNETQS